MGGPRRGPNSQQAHDVVMTSMRRNDVASTSFRRRVPIRFLINQCQIITFLILKYDIIENSRIELRGIVLPVQMGGLLGGQRVCWPPLSNYWGGPGPPWPPLFLRLCDNNWHICTRIKTTTKSDKSLKPLQQKSYNVTVCKIYKKIINKYETTLINCLTRENREMKNLFRLQLDCELA